MNPNGPESTTDDDGRHSAQSDRHTEVEIGPSNYGTEDDTE